MFQRLKGKKGEKNIQILNVDNSNSAQLILNSFIMITVNPQLYALVYNFGIMPNQTGI